MVDDSMTSIPSLRSCASDSIPSLDKLCYEIFNKMGDTFAKLCDKIDNLMTAAVILSSTMKRLQENSHLHPRQRNEGHSYAR